MKKRAYNLLFAVAVSLFSIPPALANPAGFQFSFFDVNAPDTASVKGVRIPAIYGKGNTHLTGWDLPLLAYSELGSLKGVHWAPWFISGTHIKGDMTGASVGVFNWHEGRDTGLNMAFLNVTNSVKGANLGAVNIATGHTMFDWSAFNLSGSSNVQLGIVNITDSINGLQIGLVNCAKNGFLPCFILFNFGTG